MWLLKQSFTDILYTAPVKEHVISRQIILTAYNQQSAYYMFFDRSSVKRLFQQ